MSQQRVAPCPVCKKPVEPLGRNPAFPFCSDRCRRIDLGRWFGEEYRVPSRPAEGEEIPSVSGRRARAMSGFVDLHCHLLPGVDDGARTPEDALAMARALVALGVSTVAVSPHARAGCAPVEVCVERLTALRSALVEAAVPLALELGAENSLVEDGFLESLGTPAARLVHRGPYVLVEVPYSSPVPALPALVFQMMRRGVVPLFAHPERCLEFQRPGRAAEVVALGARLQLDVGALSGRYGPVARRTARGLLDDGLYAVMATDLHAPAGAERWMERALADLRSCAGDGAVERLFKAGPTRVLAGEVVEIPEGGGVEGGTP